MYKIDLGIIDYRSLDQEQLAREIKSVNLHITKACNYRCRFCYAQFNQVKTHLSEKEWKTIITLLSENGTEKVTFVGGEPTLVSFLPNLVMHAKNLGLTTMLVTNGSRIDEEYLFSFEGALDWIGLSIDSKYEEICKILGRGNGYHVSQTLHVASLLKKFDIRLKVNTVVTSLTWKEDMSDLIARLSPERWKVFQVLPIKGENDGIEDLLITEQQFLSFIDRHRHLNPVAETNDDMIESYVMVDPNGCFFTNSNNHLTHGTSILQFGVKNAFERIPFNYKKFEKRGGEYKWRKD